MVRVTAAVGVLAIALVLALVSRSAGELGEGRCANGYVALTYDDGPSASSPALLAALQRHRLRATMFVTARNAAERPEHVRAQARAGMWIENHTLTHPDLTRLDGRRLNHEIAAAQRVVTTLTGRAPTLFRPPFLRTDDRVRAAAAKHGLSEVMITVDSRDYAGATAAAIVAAAERLEPGGNLLMHDWPPATVAAVPGIAAVLARRQLCAGRIAPNPRPARGKTFGPVVVKP